MVPIHGCLWYTTTVCVIVGRVDSKWKLKEKKTGGERKRDRDRSNVVGIGRYPRKAGEGEKQCALAGLPSLPNEVHYYVIPLVQDGQRSRPHVGTRVEILRRTCRGYNPGL